MAHLIVHTGSLYVKKFSRFNFLFFSVISACVNKPLLFFYILFFTFCSHTNYIHGFAPLQLFRAVSASSPPLRPPVCFSSHGFQLNVTNNNNKNQGDNLIKEIKKSNKTFKKRWADLVVLTHLWLKIFCRMSAHIITVLLLF
jgi:hypothetical protein